MAYTDKKNLIQELNGTIRLLTPTEVTARDQAILDERTDNRSLKAQAKSLVETLTYSAVLTHIDTVFSGLSAAQRTSLKKLYCAVLYLAKKQIK